MPKKDNPGGGGGGGGGGSGGGGSDVAFVVTGLNEEGDAIEGTCDAPPGTGITVIVTSVDSTTSWVSETGVITTVDENGNWFISLADLVETETNNDLSGESGDVTVVASYTQVNERNGKEKTVSTEETPLFLPGDSSAPVAFDDTQSTEENTVLFSAVPPATDDDGTIASYTLDQTVAEGSLTFFENGSYTFDPGSAFDDLGLGATRDVTFTYTATDNDGLVSGNQTVTITVTGTNDAPVASDNAQSTEENTVLESAVPAASDVDGTIASYTLVQPVAEGSLTFNADGSYTFDPDSAFDDLGLGATRDVTFTYTATDNDGLVSGIQTVTITVTNVVETPPPTAYTNVVVFGDSLSDNGNFAALAADFLKPGYSVPFQYVGDGSIRPYDSVAFTDGTAYADTLAGLLQLDAGYENYAFGGAQALGEKLGGGYITEYANLSYTKLNGQTGTFSIVADVDAALLEYESFDINLGAQVDRYIDAYPTGVPDGTLAVINIGANDLGEFDTSFFNILLGGVNDFANDLGDEVEFQARRLAAAGADGIALYSLPVAEFFIGYSDLNWLERPVARDLIDSVNDEIFAASNALNGDGITTEVVRLDIMSIDILDNMQTHGFLYQGPYLFGYSGDPSWVETSPGVIEPEFNVNASAMAYRPEQILFFDEIHPSGALHDVLAVFSSESLTTDEVFGSGSANSIARGSADDFVVALAGNDTVTLGAGDDVALGGLGSDTLSGGDGSDLLIGGAGGDTLQGGSGSDFLAGSAGADELSGGADDDILIGGLGSDLAFGDAGDDVFIFFDAVLWGGSGGATDSYDGGEGSDRLLVFLSETATFIGDPLLENGSATLSFGDGSTLNATNMDSLQIYFGMPDDLGGPMDDLALSSDLWARYDEAQLWGIV